MSLFDTDQTTVTHKLEDFVGEGKKYKSPDDVAKALIEKDNFIERLKAEKAEVLNELSARPAVDRSQEILDRLEALKKEPVTERTEPTVTERTEVKGLTLEDVDRVLTQREQTARATANINSVKAKLQEVYGDKYSQALKSMAEKNGLSEKALNDLAASTPQLVLNLMTQVKVGETVFTPPSSSMGFTPSAGNTRTRAYYNKIRDTNRTEYFSAKVQNQMYKDAMSLGEAFEDV